MSEKDTQMDEIVKLQYELVNTKLAAIAKTLDTYVEEIRKIIDDHEQRLREQSKELSKNTTQMTEHQLQLKDLQHDVALMREENSKRFESLQKAQEEREKRELSVWQTLGIEAIKYAAFGAGGGGILLAVAKIIGLDF